MISLYTKEQVEYLIVSFQKGVKVSRMAVKLNRSYSEIEHELVNLNLLDAETVFAHDNCKFCSPDEIDYGLLVLGNSEMDLAKIKSSSLAFTSGSSMFIGGLNSGTISED